MAKYAVYTQINNSDGSKKDVFIINLPANSLIGAEHFVLDNYRSIDNALAFDMADLGSYGLTLMQISEVMELSTFNNRYNVMICKRQSNIDAWLDEIEDARSDNSKAFAELAHLKSRVCQLEAEIRNNNEYISFCNAELVKYCKTVNMKAEHSTDEVQGIA